MLPSILSTLSVLSCAIGASASPAAAKNVARGTYFSVPAERNLNSSFHPADALLRLYAKYSLTPGEKVSAEFLSALDKRSGSAIAKAYTQAAGQYLVTVTIGGQELNLVFDTASDDLWLHSTLTGPKRLGGQRGLPYDPTKSKTYKRMYGMTWELNYPGGNGVYGIVGNDTIIVGDLTVIEQAIQLATGVRGSLIQDDYPDGTLGLGLGTQNSVLPEAQKTFFQNLEHTLSKKVITAYLPKDGKGSFDFGIIDLKKYTGDIQYIDINTAGSRWEVQTHSYQVQAEGNQQPDISVLATSAVYLAMKSTIANEYYHKVKDAQFASQDGLWTFPCKEELPAFTFLMGSTSVSIPGSNLRGPASGDRCTFLLQSVSDTDQNVIGAPFFNTFLGVFDYENQQFGFASIASQ